MYFICVSSSSAGLGGYWRFWSWFRPAQLFWSHTSNRWWNWWAEKKLSSLHFFGLLNFSSMCCPDSFWSMTLPTVMLLSLMQWCTGTERSSRRRNRKEEECRKAILLLDVNLILNSGWFRCIYHSTLHCRKFSVISYTVWTSPFRH